MADDAVYLAALEHERSGYARYGRKDRVADVDAEIARVKRAMKGADPEPATEVAAEPETTGVAPPENTARPRGRPRKT